MAATCLVSSRQYFGFSSQGVDANPDFSCVILHRQKQLVHVGHPSVQATSITCGREYQEPGWRLQRRDDRSDDCASKEERDLPSQDHRPALGS